MKIALIAAALMLPMTQPAEAPQRGFDQPSPMFSTRQLTPDRAGCTPIAVQVAGEDRNYRGTRLDQQPPAQLLLAVDREVDGCREATIIRRDIGGEPAERPEPGRR